MRLEDVIQEEFPSTMNQLFDKIEFYDTHLDKFIAKPQKPDVTVVPRGLYLHTQSTLALVELHHTLSPIDGSMKGQVISAVNRVHATLIEKREVWGFAINGCGESFVYKKKEIGGNCSLE